MVGRTESDMKDDMSEVGGAISLNYDGLLMNDSTLCKLILHHNQAKYETISDSQLVIESRKRDSEGQYKTS